MKRLSRFLGLSALLILAGCQSVLDAPTEVQKPTEEIAHNDPMWQQHLTKLAQIKGYDATGQFGYIAPDERFSSHFDWQYQTPSQFGLTLSSNLSTKSLKLQRNAKGLTVSDSEGHSRTESDVNGLMEEMIGVSFPIDQFAYWLKGQPEKEGKYIVNEKRLLSQFSYVLNGQAWQASYVEYHTDTRPALPKLIVLKNGDKTLKVRIDHWTY